MKNLKLFPVFLFFISNAIHAQTTISGNIYSSTTWTTAGSPYTITNSIVVFEGAVLTINPRVVVYFSDGVNVDMRGILYAVGTPSQRIIFTSVDTAPVAGAYVGVKVSGGSYSVFNQITLAYCNISYAHNFMNLSTMEGPFNINHCSFSNNIFAIGNSPYAGDLNIDSCRFESNYQGVNWNENGTVY